MRDNDDPFKEHQILSEQTLRKLLPGDLLLSDRNREDFRFINGGFSFRYRNRVTIERELPLFKRRNVTPLRFGRSFTTGPAYPVRNDRLRSRLPAVGSFPGAKVRVDHTKL